MPIGTTDSPVTTGVDAMQISTHRDQSLHDDVVLANSVMKRHILCATDLGARSRRAMQRAALLADQMNAEVLFVHAVSDKLAGRVLRMKTSRTYARLMAECRPLMKRTPYDVLVQIGRPLDVLIEAARVYKPDLILMAPPRRRRLDVMLGTTAERIVRATGRSVLLAGTPAERNYEHVVLATDLSPASEHVTRAAVAMGVLSDADVWAVHAMRLPFRDIASSSDVDPVADTMRQVRQRLAVERDLRRSLKDAGLNLEHVQLWTEQAPPLHAIRNAMDHVRPELLVIGVSRWFALKRILIGSVADQLFRSASCDVLAISPPASEKRWLHAA